MEATKIYLSCADPDRKAVQAVVQELLHHGPLEVWDRHRAVSSRPWPEALGQWMGECQGLVLCCGAGGLDPWQVREFGVALCGVPLVDDERGASIAGGPRGGLDSELGFHAHAHGNGAAARVLVVVLPGADIRTISLVREFGTWVDLRQGLGAQAREHLRDWRLGAGPSVGKLPPDLCPYLGLTSYGEVHAGLYVGHPRVRERLLQAVEQGGPVLLTGPAGSGKTSLIQAGLVPRLRRRCNPQGSWDCVYIRLGRLPFHRLAEALLALSDAEADGQQRKARAYRLGDRLAVGGVELGAVLDKLRAGIPVAPRLLLVVDSLEQLFWSVPEVEGRAFVEALLDAAEGEGICVVLCLRAEYYSPLLGLGDAVATHLEGRVVHMAAMRREALLRVITEPARRCGLEFEDGLVATLLQDAEAVGDNLPLLSFALVETWNRREGCTLTYNGYVGAGRIAGALEQRAEQAVRQLGQAGPAKVQMVFRRLLQRQEGEPDVSWASEPLLQGWVRARTWAAEEQGFHLWHTRLEAALEQERQKGHEQEGYQPMLHGAAQWEARSWLERRRADLGPEQREFIQRSVRAADNGRVDSPSGKMRLRAKLRRRLGLLWTVVVVLGLVAVLALQQWWFSDQELRRVQLAQGTGTMAAHGLGRPNNNAGLDAEAEAGKGQAAAARRQVVKRLPSLVLGHRRPVQTLAYSPDGRWLVTGSDDGKASIWDVVGGERKADLEGHRLAVTHVAFSPNGRRIVTSSRDRTARVWDAGNGRQLLLLRGHLGPVNYAEFSQDGRKVVTAGADNAVRVWDSASGQLLLELKGHLGAVNQALFSPDDRAILSAGSDGSAWLWDAGDGHLLRRFAGRFSFVERVAFSPDGRRIATAGGNPLVRMWDVASGEVLAELEGHADRVRDVAFSPDGQYLMTAGSDATIRIWDADTGKQLFVLRGHDGPVLRAVYSPDGRLLASGGDDHTVRLWDPSKGTALAVLSQHVDKVLDLAFSPDGTHLASAGKDSTVRIWTIEF